MTYLEFYEYMIHSDYSDTAKEILYFTLDVTDCPKEDLDACIQEYVEVNIDNIVNIRGMSVEDFLTTREYWKTSDQTILIRVE